MEGHDDLFAAVIERTDANESIELAIRSVINNKAYFCEVHIVQTQGKSAKQYAKFEDDISSLGLPVVYHSLRFNPNKIERAHAAVFIQGDLQVTDGALNNLREDMVQSARFHPSITHFAVESTLKVDTQQQRILSMFYGFWIVVLVLDFYRSLFNLNKYHRTNDLRAELVYTTFGRKELAPERWSWWVWNNGMTRIIKGGAALLQSPSDKIPVLRMIQTHRYMGFGIWLLFYLVYYFFCALPWWNPLFYSPERTLLSAIMTRSAFTWYGILWMVLHMLMAAVLTWRNMDMPLASIQILLFPLYLTLSPAFFLFARWYTPRATWVIHKKNQ